MVIKRSKDLYGYTPKEKSDENMEWMLHNGYIKEKSRKPGRQKPWASQGMASNQKWGFDAGSGHSRKQQEGLVEVQPRAWMGSKGRWQDAWKWLSWLRQGTQKLTDVSRFRDESDSFIWSCAHTCERGDFFSLYYVYIYCDYIFLCLFSPPFPLILLAVPLLFYRTSVRAKSAHHSSK